MIFFVSILLLAGIIVFVALKVYSIDLEVDRRHAAHTYTHNSFPEMYGEAGESLISDTLRNNLSDEYHVIDDIYLPLPDGTTTQLDHVVVSRYGIFIVETKTYSGWIFGNAESSRWMQITRRSRNRFQNPLRQNYRHKCALAGCLGIPKSLIMDVVVFNGRCEFKTEMPPGVLRRSQVAGYIMSFTKVLLKDKNVSEIVSAVSEWDASVDKNRRSAHVSNLRKRHSAVSVCDEKPKCPYCGKEMVLRTSRKDGNRFYGCSAYPACKGIVNISDFG